jgi:DNA modification methylase
VDLISLPDLLARFEPRNARKHDLPTIIDSLTASGFVAPGLINEGTGRLVAGHGRALALAQMHRDDPTKPPDRIEVRGGEWFIPVLRGVTFSSDVAALRYLVADNRASEKAEWDLHDLGTMLNEIREADSLLGTGYSDKELDRLLAIDRKATEDAPTEEVAAPVSKLGTVWELGDHRLVCGDCTDPAVVLLATKGNLAQLVVTDPPYGIGYDTGSVGCVGVTQERKAELGTLARKTMPRIAGDELAAQIATLLDASLSAILPATVPDVAVYVWHPSKHASVFEDRMQTAGLLIHSQIIWVKDKFVFGTMDYHGQHEACFYGWPTGHRPNFVGVRDQSTVWQVASVPRDERKLLGHATPKPVELYSRPIANHLTAGGLILDPFAGSGPAVIAAEQLGVRCAAIELDPANCDAIAARWARLTGGLPTRVSG